MAMGTRRQREKQEDLWIAHTELASSPGHPFYQRLNELLEAEGFDEFVESRCAKFYAARYGRPSVTPGIYFRSLLIGYFEGIGAERGIAWRLADSLALRRFVGIGLDEYTPDHSTISRTRRLIDRDTHRSVFAWVLGVLADHGLLQGKRIGIDATTLEANAAMRSIVRRDTGESYEEFLCGLAKASGMETPTREDLARLDRKRKSAVAHPVLHFEFPRIRIAPVDADCVDILFLVQRNHHPLRMQRVITKANSRICFTIRPTRTNRLHCVPPWIHGMSRPICMWRRTTWSREISRASTFFLRAELLAAFPPSYRSPCCTARRKTQRHKWRTSRSRAIRSLTSKWERSPTGSTCCPKTTPLFTCSSPPPFIVSIQTSSSAAPCLRESPKTSRSGLTRKAELRGWGVSSTT